VANGNPKPEPDQPGPETTGLPTIGGHDGLLAIFEGIDEPVYVADPESYELLFVNRALESRFGANNRRKCYQYLQQRQAPCPFCTNDLILGEYLGRSYVWEFRNQSNGHWYKCIDKAIRWPDGRLVRYEMAIDIDARKRAEDAIRQREEQLRSLSDNLPGGLVYQITCSADNPARRFTYISAGVEELHEVSAEQVLQDAGCIYNQIHEEDLRDFAQGEARALESMTPFAAEVRLTLPSGRTCWRLLHSAPRHLPDGQVVWDGVEIDITELKHGERERERLREQLNQAQKMESVGRLAGGIAHDFNNMLSVILGHTELALDRLPPQDMLREALQDIRLAAERSSRLTRQLLAFARKQTVLPRVLDLNRTIDGMLGMLRQLIGESLELAWLPGSGAGCVLMDPSQIDQVLVNLCLNARDAVTEHGRITIETAHSELDPEYCASRAGFVPGIYEVLTVTDDGVGMGPETLAHLFEPFFTTKQEGQGTGLGLATVYGIVRQNNGFINVYSEPGRGTAFRIYLPTCAGEATPGPANRENHPPEATPEETILLVEDEPLIREIACKMLRRLGYQVLVAETPTEANRLATEHEGPIHLLLTDVVMPRMSGRDLANRITALFPSIRLLFMSGYTANVIAHHGVLDPGVHFLQKPFSLQELATKVRQALVDREIGQSDGEARQAGPS